MNKGIHLVLAIAGALIVSSCTDDIIPEDRFGDIYLEFFIADTYVNLNPDLVRAADTLSVYQAIVEKHGYTMEQFLNSQGYYLSNAEKFSRILKKTQQNLIKGKKEVQERHALELEAAQKAAEDTLKAPEDTLKAEEETTL